MCVCGYERQFRQNYMVGDLGRLPLTLCRPHYTCIGWEDIICPVCISTDTCSRCRTHGSRAALSTGWRYCRHTLCTRAMQASPMVLYTLFSSSVAAAAFPLVADTSCPWRSAEVQVGGSAMTKGQSQMRRWMTRAALCSAYDYHV